MRPSAGGAQVAARRALGEEALSALRAREAAQHAKNRTKPPEAYLPHTVTVLSAERLTQADALPAGIKTLAKRCEETGVTYVLGRTVARDVDGFGVARDVESVCLVCPSKNLLVAYESGTITSYKPVTIAIGGTACFVKNVKTSRVGLTFARALSPGIPGKGSLTDAKRVLGIEVAERKPRTKKAVTVVSKPAGRKDTLR